MQFDVIVAGGSYAGIAAALQIARARRRVAVIDAGVRRNRFADASHGFLGQDGRNPAAIVADARWGAGGNRGAPVADLPVMSEKPESRHRRGGWRRSRRLDGRMLAGLAMAAGVLVLLWSSRRAE